MTNTKSGQRELLPNVLASGIAYLIAAAIGFIMPRVIYDSVGPVSLGLWDLGWSFLLYVSFSGFGFGPAMAHFVAYYRANDDSLAEAKVYATGMTLQVLFACVITIAFVVGLTVVNSSTQMLSVADVEVLSRLLLILGIAVFAVIIGDAAHGMLLASHKGRITEYINVIHDILLAITMVSVLLMGYGIVGLAMATAALRVLAEATRYTIATSICARFNWRLSNVSENTARAILRYGIKTSASVFQELVVLQATRLVLFLSAGPIALAAFSRYATIVRQLNRLIDRLSISIPTIASELDAGGNLDAVRNLYIRSTCVALLLILPALVIFWVLGDFIVKLWMGDDFVRPGLAWMLAGACALHAQYCISMRSLSGINKHGRITLACLLASCLALGAGYAFSYPVLTDEAALYVSLVMLLTVHLPFALFASWRLQVGWHENLRLIYFRPLAVNAGFFVLLLAVRSLYVDNLWFAGNSLLVVGLAVLVWIYWVFALDDSNKQFMRGAVRTFGGARELWG